MKATVFALFALLSVFSGFSAADTALRGKVQDRKITEVVKLLQTLLDKSQAEGDSERELYGKYKCYCDTNEAEKQGEIAALTQDIAVLEAKIEELLAASGKLSKEVAKLDADMTQNAKDRQEAQGIRDKERLDFFAKDADFKEAIRDMRQAIRTLAEVGADQTLNSARDHEQYMAGFQGLQKLRASVKTALVAASSFVSQKQAEHVESFLQAPFTGTYSARSGEVVGILKDMNATFTANHLELMTTEYKAGIAHHKFMVTTKQAYDDMEASFNTKQAELGDNDADLSAKRTQLEAAQNQLAEAQDFLAKLIDMCAAKKKQYEKRVELRSQEQAALSEAVAILNSDAAFATFGKVSATSTGALQFVQMKSTVRRHRQLQPAAAAAVEPRQQAAGFLQAAARVKGSSPLLGRIFAMLQANNPFKTVLEEIEKMLAIIEKEGKADLEQKGWCDTERTETNDGIDAAKIKISDLGAAIGELHSTINDPVTGLIAQIKNTETELQENYDSQVSETKDRKEENQDYQKDISNLVEAEALVAQAVKVLKAYYSKIVEGGLLQVHDDPAPPATWEDKYQGQSQEGTGAVGMLEFILENTQKEEAQAHEDEASSQHDYEDSMQQLKDSEAAMQQSLAGLKVSLTESEKELMLKREDLAKTEAEKAALEAYLLKIKPGCDFIDTHLNDRVTNRAKESASLKSAVALLKQTPAYKEALEVHHQNELAAAGCQDTCNKNEDHVDCKACLADTSVPGYCAGHPSTFGC